MTPELPTKARHWLNDIATGVMWFGLLIVAYLFVGAMVAP